MTTLYGGIDQKVVLPPPSTQPTREQVPQIRTQYYPEMSAFPGYGPITNYNAAQPQSVPDFITEPAGLKPVGRPLDAPRLGLSPEERISLRGLNFDPDAGKNNMMLYGLLALGALALYLALRKKKGGK